MTDEEDRDGYEDFHLEFINSIYKKRIDRAITDILWRAAQQENKYGLYDYALNSPGKIERCLHKAHTHLLAAQGPEPYDNKVNPINGSTPMNVHHADLALVRLMIAVGLMKQDDDGDMKKLEEVVDE